MLASLLLAGCSYSAHLGIAQQLANKQSRNNLIEKLEEEKTKSVDQVVRLLNLGMLYRLNGQYQQSIGAWEEAKRYIASQRAASISEGITSFFINNSVESYSPNATEEQNLHLFQAANFLDLGRPDGARVEVLQREQLLKEYPPGLHYPFADYFAGIVFELNHEPDQALVSYRRAVKGYRRVPDTPPLSLLQDYARLLDALGEREELDQLLDNQPIDYTKTRPNLTILIARGLVPEKVEHRVVHFSRSYSNSFSIALPRYPPATHTSQTSLQINGGNYRLSQASNIDGMVRFELAQSMDALLAQAVLRQVAKRGIANALTREKHRDKNDPVAGLLLFAISQAFVHATEAADLRSWNSLPAGIDIYRAHHQAGSYIIHAPNSQPLKVELQHADQVLRLLHQIDA